MLFSIIIPVYNAEKTILRSLSAIRFRDSDSLEILIINDGSTDGTAAILEEYRTGCPYKVRVIYQENQGAASARNRALEVAEGDYLLFLDADDSFAPGALDRISELTPGGADIIGWDWKNEEAPGKTREMRQADYSTPADALGNMMGGTMKWNLWLFAVKKDLVRKSGLRFLSGADMGEDMAFMLKAFARADTVCQVHESLYLYNASNPSSISNSLNARRRAEVERNLASAIQFLSGTRHAGLCESMVPQLKLYIKRPLLISDSVQDYKVWYEWFPEVNHLSASNRSLPLRIRILQRAASHKAWWLVRIYNFAVYKVLLPIMH